MQRSSSVHLQTPCLSLLLQYSAGFVLQLRRRLRSRSQSWIWCRLTATGTEHTTRIQRSAERLAAARDQLPAHNLVIVTYRQLHPWRGSRGRRSRWDEPHAAFRSEGSWNHADRYEREHGTEGRDKTGTSTACVCVCENMFML